MGKCRPLFRPFHIPITILIIQIGKSIDSVDGIRIRDRRMVVAGETMELG